MLVADEIMLNEVKKEVDIMASDALFNFPETPSLTSLLSEYYEATQTSSISSILPGIACQMDATRVTYLWSIAQVRSISFTTTLDRYTAIYALLDVPQSCKRG
jgi:hypothetical protein